jgi:hypothetical protein
MATEGPVFTVPSRGCSVPLVAAASFAESMS